MDKLENEINPKTTPPKMGQEAAGCFKTEIKIENPFQNSIIKKRKLSSDLGVSGFESRPLVYHKISIEIRLRHVKFTKQCKHEYRMAK